MGAVIRKASRSSGTYYRCDSDTLSSTNLTTLRGSASFSSNDDNLSTDSLPRRRITTKKVLLVALVVSVLLALVIGLAVGLTRKPTPTPQKGCENWKPKQYSKGYYREKSHDGIRWQDLQCPVMAGKPECPTSFTDPPLLLISLDGFRADYINRNITPNIKKLSDCGVSAPSVRPVFPSQTFPSHYSIITGLYPESHGIIADDMYDIDLKRIFSPYSREQVWWGGEPFWNSVQRTGRKSATMFWPGSDVPVNGHFPDYCYNYNESVPYDARVNEVLHWLDLQPTERPAFITLNLEEPDVSGGRAGPFGDLLNKAVEEVDKHIGALMDGIHKRKLDKCINIILTADHGMDTVECKKVITLPKYINTSQVHVYDGPIGRISSKYLVRKGKIVLNENPEPAENIVKKLEGKHWYMNVFKKEDLPKRYHYSYNNRIDEVTLDLERHWLVSRERQMAQHRCEGGEHGYDNTFESMQAVFLAYGPAFKEKTKVEPFELIEVYNMMAEILDIEKPAPNNGTKGSLSHLLANPKDVPTSLEPAKSHYESCKFPNYAEWLLRSNRSDCRCDNFTNISSGKSVWQVDLQLNLTQDQVEHATQRHLPLGIPVLTMENAAVGTLTQTDFIVGFDKKFHTPRWTAFRLDGQKGKPVLNDSRVNTAIPACVRTDVRLSSESDANCSSYEEPAQNITTGYLFHPGFSDDSLRRMDSLISSNIVPMYRNFLTGIWKDAMLLVEEFAEKYGVIHVMTGPVYDYDANGHRDDKAQIKRFVSNGPVPLPTHYYVAAARCETGGDVGKCDHDSVLALAIVIPHRPAILNSKKPIDYLKDNVVRIKDLELLTGLQLFPNITGSNRIILKTFLAVGLWPRFSWMDEEKCIGPEEPVCPWSDSAPLLLISLDGYRDSYLERNLNPVIQKLFKCGSKAPYMRSIYPTLTFPNHYSIVTGLYPESHGIVDNSMYDMNISLPFYLGSPFMNDTRWWLGEPLWNTVTKHKKTAMTFFWPGSDVIIHGKRPNKWVQFNGNYPYAGRVDAILNWINGGTGKRPDFLTLYMELVDKAGHSGGENSLQVNESLVEVDLLMGQLMDGLYRVGLHNCINIIVTADHGMADIAPERNEFLKDYLSNATLSNTYSFLGPAGRISNLYKRSKSPKKGNTHIPPELQTKIADIMNNLTCKTQHMAEYEKPNFAKRHHYAATDRIDSILLYLQEEWQVSRDNRDNPILHFLKGNHGWDPNLESMWALFIAHGPDIKPQHTIKPFENIELYNLMADLLNITAAPNNGTRGSLYHIMRKPPSLAIPSGNPYDSCDFPNDKAEYERRANRTCDCENSTLPDPADVRKWDHRLNLTNDIQHQLANKHMPHGTLLSPYNGSLCLLYHQDFVSAYASALKLPLWTASTVTKSMVSSATGVSSLGPVRPDVRLEQSDQINNCYYLSIKDQNISQASLFTPAFSTNKTTVTDTWIWTNGVPMLSGFLDGIWQYLLKRVKGWVTRYGDLHIVAGPVYDYNYDGVADTTEDIQKNKDEHLNMSLPTHYYMVLLRCPSTNPMKCRDMDYDVQSFILPHLPNVTNCMTEDAYLLEHVARIRDIELLTSMQFLAANNTQTAILTRTYIPHELWLP